MSFAVGAYPSGVYPSGATAEGKSFAPNNTVQTYDGKRFTYVLASTSITTGQVVAITTAGVAQAATSALASATPRIGVAQNDIASGSYGWAQTFGACSVSVLSTCSASVALYTSGTAGALDDTSTSQVKIAGITVLANVTAAAIVAGMIAAEPFTAL